MVWKHNSATDGKNVFDPQLLEFIKEKDTEQFESALKNAENLCYAVDSSGASLLHYAAECGNESAVKLLIESGANVDLQDQNGQTPLMSATKGKHEGTTCLLLENDADMYICDAAGVSALGLALQETLKHPCTLVFIDEIQRDLASRNGFEIADRLLKVNCPLYIAARVLDNADVLKHMVSAGGSAIDAADPIYNRTALHVSVQTNSVKDVRLLVERGANVNALDASNQTPLALIKTFRTIGTQDMYYEKYESEGSETCDTYFVPSAVLWKQEILEILINAGTDLTACTADGKMQVYSALKCGLFRVIEIALKTMGDLRARDSRGQTVVHYLAANDEPGNALHYFRSRFPNDDMSEKSKEQRKTASFLRRVKRAFVTDEPSAELKNELESEIVEWDVRDEDGRTALHHAMAAGNSLYVKYLIDKNANVNAKSNNGLTPFFEAVESTCRPTILKRVACVKLVMEQDDAEPAAEIERYLEIYRTKSARNRHFRLLEPVLEALVLRQDKGEDIPRKVLDSIDRHAKLKNYVDAFRDELKQTKSDNACQRKSNKIYTSCKILLKKIS